MLMKSGDKTARGASDQRRNEITAFYAPPPVGENSIITLPPDEAKHARAVCRLGPGDPITVVDGQGLAHFCEVVSAAARAFSCRVVKSVKNWGEPPVAIDLAAGLSKSGKFDFTCEKATELGANRIIPFTSDKSTVKIDDPAAAKRKIARYRRLTFAAMKQCRRSVWPQVEPIESLDRLCGRFESYHRILVGDPGPGSLPIRKAGELFISARKILLIVGPESGLSPAEITRLRALDAFSITLGPRRLRTETATVAFLARVIAMFED
jgi:16S rRNA (uracil1498-N3)-methyltransferase